MGKQKEVKAFFREMRKQMSRIADVYADAVKEGAASAGERIRSASATPGITDRELARQAAEALKQGVRQAGERLVASGSEFVERMRDSSGDR